MITRHIERKTCLSREETRSALDAESSQAIVLTDVVPHWPAFERWSFENLAYCCGDDPLVLSDDLANPSVYRKRTLRDYIAYVQDPKGHPLSREIDGVVWYAGYYSPFAKHPEMLQEFTTPECLDSWFEHLQGPMADWYQRGFGWLLIGPAGTQTAPHFDLFSTHAWTAQLQGKKRFIFYPPDRQEPFDDVERVMRQEPVETIIERGDLLIVPADWCHAAQSLEASMTLTYNFVNQTNFGRFLQSTYAYPEKWQIKAKDPQLRAAMGLAPLSAPMPAQVAGSSSVGSNSIASKNSIGSSSAAA